MHESRLFKGAPEALSINAHWVNGHGWACTLRLRHAGEDWHEASSVTYSDLSTAELLDVLDLELPRAFPG